MRKVLFSALLAVAATISAMAQINCEPGKLHMLVSDKSTSTLTVAGKMDARDFKFIAQELNSLTSVDLKAVEIVAYEDLGSPLIGNEYSFAAGHVPTLSFAGKSRLQSVVLPTSAKSIGEAAFGACTSLTSITWPTSLNEIGNYAFTACSALTSVTLPSSLASVGKGAFSRCTAVKTVKQTTPVSAAALTLGDEAFMDCALLETIDLKANLASIGNATFAGTGIKVINFAQYTKLKAIGDWAFTRTGVTSATLPASVQTMGQGAFLYDDKLTSIALSKQLNDVGDYAFAGNEALETVTMPNDLKSIGNYAFYGAKAIKNIEIPEKVTFMGTKAMAGTTGLKHISTHALTPAALGEDVWAGVDQSAAQLAVPRKAYDEFTAAEQWKEFNTAYYYLLCDADEDWEISVGDLNIVINCILGLRDSWPEQTDYDGDGVIDVTDMNAVINFILGVYDYRYITVDPTVDGSEQE